MLNADMYVIKLYYNKKNTKGEVKWVEVIFWFLLFVFFKNSDNLCNLSVIIPHKMWGVPTSLWTLEVPLLHLGWWLLASRHPAWTLITYSVYFLRRLEGHKNTRLAFSGGSEGVPSVKATFWLTAWFAKIQKVISQLCERVPAFPYFFSRMNPIMKNDHLNKCLNLSVQNTFSPL